MALLQAVAEQGSISAAARQLSLSYRHVWGELKRWEELLGHELIVWEKGQSARLTEFGDKLMWAERLTQARLAPQLEALRAAGTIGSALDADVAIYAEAAAHEALATVGDELRFWFITSDASAQPLSLKPATASEAKLENGQTIWIAATATSADKCSRCWHRRPDVDSHATHPALCGRCISNIDGPGEARLHV